MQSCDQGSCEKQIFDRWMSELTADGVLLPVKDLLVRAAERFPDNVALIDEENEITYKDLYSQAKVVSGRLSSCGVRAGDRVIILCQNSIEFYLFYFGVLQLAATAVPVNTFLNQNEIIHIIKDCDPRCILASKEFAEQESDVTVYDMKSLQALPVADEFLDHQTADTPALILYTSGTTGMPRGVMLSSGNVMTNVVQVATRFETFGCKQERFFAILPLFHVFAQNACIWLPFLTGSSVVVVPKIERRAIRRGLEKDPTVFLGFPALYGLLCLMGNAKLDSVKLFISGADMMPSHIRIAFGMIYGRSICSGYGLTEASPAIAVDIGDQAAPTESVGSVLPGIEYEVRDSDGLQVSNCEVGKLWVRGNNVMMGYYNSEEATNNVLKDGWLNTGDLVSLDSSGRMLICGREKDLIIHKGFNIYPQEIEQVLAMHPVVAQVAVVGSHDKNHGQVPVAFVVLKAATSGACKILSKFCRERLALYKIPRSIVCVDNLPMNSTGKIDKKALGRRLSSV